MAEFPALPLFTDAFIGDTTHLTAAQTGAYLMLLMIEWRTDDCMLPDDDKILARYARMDLRQWMNNRSIVIAFFQKHSSGRLFQARLLDERNYVVQLRNKNSQAGKASALKRLNRGSTSVPTKLQQESNPLPTPTPLLKNKTIEDIVLQETKPKPKIKGSRLSPEWALQQEEGEWAVREGMTGQEVLNEAQKFKDYWLAKAGAGAVKVDWIATWRNWIRSTIERKTQNGLQSKFK